MTHFNNNLSTLSNPWDISLNPLSTVNPDNPVSPRPNTRSSRYSGIMASKG